MMLWHWLPRKSSSAIFPWTAFCFPPFLAKCCCQSTLDLCAQSPPNMEMESTHQYLFHTKHKSLTLVLRFWRWKTIYWRITNHWYRFAFGKTLSRFANSSIDKSELYRSFFFTTNNKRFVCFVLRLAVKHVIVTYCTLQLFKRGP